MTGPTWQLEAPGPSFRVDQRTGRTTVREVWFCVDYPWPYNLSWDAIEGTVPRTLGSAYESSGLFASAVCVNIQRVYGPHAALSGQLGQIKCVVEFDSAIRFGAAYKRTTASAEADGRSSMRVPIVTKILSGVGSGADVFGIAEADQWPELIRPSLRRVARNVVSGNPDALSHLIVQQIGAGYFFRDSPFVADSTGTPYILIDFSVREIPTGGNQVEYTFLTTGPVPAIPAGTYPGQDIDLPALNFLEVWGTPVLKHGFVPLVPVIFPNVRPGAVLP